MRTPDAITSDGAVTITAAQDNGTSNTRTATRDTTAPDVVSLTGPSDRFYAAGDQLIFDVLFGENIDVAGTPRIHVTIGTNIRHATLQTTQGGRTTRFIYEVVAEDIDHSGGIELANGNKIQQNSGEITDSVGNGFDFDTLLTPTAWTGVSMGVTATLNTPPSYINIANKGDYSLSGTCAGTNLVSVRLSKDSTSAAGSVACASSAWSIDLDTASITSDGAVGIVVIQNGASAASVNVERDATAPTMISASRPADGWHAVGTTLEFTWNFSESVDYTRGTFAPKIFFKKIGAAGSGPATEFRVTLSNAKSVNDKIVFDKTRWKWRHCQ